MFIVLYYIVSIIPDSMTKETTSI